MAKAIKFGIPNIRVSRRRSVVVTDIDNMTPLLRDLPVIREEILQWTSEEVRKAVAETFWGNGLGAAWAPNKQSTVDQKGGGKTMSESGELAANVEIRRTAPGFDIGAMVGSHFAMKYVGWFEQIHPGTTTANPRRFFPDIRRTPPLSRAQLAAVHEFGLPKERALGRPRAAIPARPWLTQAADEKGPLILEHAVIRLWGVISLYANVRPPKTPILHARARGIMGSHVAAAGFRMPPMKGVR